MSDLTVKELREISLKFRRVSSNLLTSDVDNADVNYARFWNFINETAIVLNIIQDAIMNVDYDFRECFYEKEAVIDIPVNEGCHIKAMYDYLGYVVVEREITVKNQALFYFWIGNSFNEMIRSYSDKCFKPLIDYIIDQLSIMLMDEINSCSESQLPNNTIYQSIQNVNGDVNQFGTSIIVNSCNQELLNNIEVVLSKLSEISSEECAAINDIRDDFELVKEQMTATSPKKTRVEKALRGIKDFTNQVAINTIANAAAAGLMTVDWSGIIHQIEQFLNNL